MGTSQSKGQASEMNEKQQQQSRQRNSAAVARAGLYQSLEPAQRPAESVDAAESVDGAWKQKQETSLLAQSQPRQQHVSVADAERWSKEVLGDAKNRLALLALSKNAASSILTRQSVFVTDKHIFNITIPIEGSPVTNQRSSGRCWIFASTNVFRVAYMRRYGLAEFELSQAYLFFWDKLEKANYFLENIVDTAKEPLDGRLVQTLLAGPVGDGGQWDMIVNLVQKYGLVPQSLYPDAFHARNSGEMDRLLTSMLRQDALELRALSRAPRSQSSDGPDLATAKQTMMTDIHRVLTLMLGPPPAPTAAFTWTYRDKAGRVSSVRSSPLQFAGELSSAAGVRACGGTDVGQLFSLVHDPRNAAERLLTVARLGNVVGGLPIRYANVARPTIKRACVAMLRRGLPVFFGCDVGKALDGAHGVLDVDLFAHELAFGLRPRLDKADRLRVGESQMTHAMVLTGVHLDPSGCPVRWRIQNSWSESSGEHGYLLMTDAWMDEYVYQAVVDPAFVDADVNAILSQEAQVLPLWDPMGSLA